MERFPSELGGAQQSAANQDWKSDGILDEGRQFQGTASELTAAAQEDAEQPDIQQDNEVHNLEDETLPQDFALQADSVVPSQNGFFQQDQEHMLEQLDEPMLTAPVALPASTQKEQSQADRSAARLSRELRNLQAETVVLQEHSRRLQEKAAVIQQQRVAEQASFVLPATLHASKT